MKATELEPLVKTQEAIIDLMQKQLAAMDASLKQNEREATALKVQVGKVEERLANHIAHVEKWDARRWTTIGFFIAALISLVANLVVVMVRK
jgi:hypothetical protein